VNVLVTGATGFIGTQLVRHLVAQGRVVHALCRDSSNAQPIAARHVQLFRGDVRDQESVSHAMRGCDQVFHLAACTRNWTRDPAVFARTNIDGTRNILEAALRLQASRVVFTSTALTLGPSNGTVVDENVRRSTPCFTDYERSKVAAEEVVTRYAQQGLDVVTTQPTRVYGPGLLTESNSVTRIIRLYLQGRWRTVVNHGRGVANYVFVGDVVQGLLLAADTGRSGERYVLGGENVSYRTLFDLVARISGSRRRLLHVPGTIAVAGSRLEELRARYTGHYPLVSPGWMRSFLVDWAVSCAKAETELGYCFVSLEEGVSRTIAWLERGAPDSWT
jgi:nucleoside-diphosphate-sugar epimerase